MNTNIQGDFQICISVPLIQSSSFVTHVSTMGKNSELSEIKGPNTSYGNIWVIAAVATN